MKEALEKLCAEGGIPIQLKLQLSNVAKKLASNPDVIGDKSEELHNISYLGFEQVKELVDANIGDEPRRQEIFRAIYGEALAKSPFAITTIEGGKGKVGTTDIEIHERTHFVIDRIFPTHLPNIEELGRVERIRSQFFEDEPFRVEYYSVTDTEGKELENEELVQINHKLMTLVISVVSDNPLVQEEYKKDAIRNARDEVVTITIGSMAEEKPYHLESVEFIKYATSGCHYFDRDPNLDIDQLRKRIESADTTDEKRRVITDYLRNGF